MTSNPTLMELLGLEPGMAVATMNPAAQTYSDAISAVVGESGRVHKALAPLPTDLASHSYDQIILANLSQAELQELRDLLQETHRLLRNGGRLFVIGQGSEAPPFSQVVRALEMNSWTIHRYLELGPHEYLIEATVTDESVQS
jgi:hypothetical protein